MNWKIGLLGVMLVACSFAALVGCNKPPGADKGTSTPAGPPANTTEPK